MSEPRQLPERVTVGYKQIEIISREIEGENGAYQSEKRRIIIGSDQHPDERANTLLHEILHAICDVYYIKFSKGDDEEERVVYGVANGLMDVFQKNPEVRDFIFHELSR